MRITRIKRGDIVFIETPAESGHALVEDNDGKIHYAPIGGSWQRSRINRPPVRAQQVTAWWRRANG